MASTPPPFLPEFNPQAIKPANTSAVFFLSLIANVLLVLFSIWGIIRFGQYSFDLDNQFTFVSKEGKTCWRDGEGAWLAGHDHEWIRFSSTTSMISAILNATILLFLVTPSKLSYTKSRLSLWATFFVGLSFIIPAILNLVFFNDGSKYMYFNVNEQNEYIECDGCETNPAYCFVPFSKQQNSVFSGLLILWMLALIGQFVVLYLSFQY